MTRSGERLPVHAGLDCEREMPLLVMCEASLSFQKPGRLAREVLSSKMYSHEKWDF